MYKLDNLESNKIKIMTLFTTNYTSANTYKLKDKLSNYDILVCNMWVDSYYEGCYVDTTDNFISRKRPAFLSGTISGSQLRYIDDISVSWQGGYGIDIVGIKF